MLLGNKKYEDGEAPRYIKVGTMTRAWRKDPWGRTSKVSCENTLLSLLRDTLSFPPSLQGIWCVLSAEQIVPPAEAACIVANELFVVNIVMICASPEWEEMVEAPGKFIAAVGIDSLEEAQHNPNVHGEDVQVASDGTPEDRAANSAKPKDHDFDRRRIFSCQTKWC